MRARGATRLCEKVPINAFRLRLIVSIFPDAHFVYIERNGIEVARSIAAKAEAGQWFGNRKWDMLIEIAQKENKLKGIAAQCTSLFHQGLLEWVLSTVSARRFLGESQHRAVAVQYSELLDTPNEVARRIEAGCELSKSAELAGF